MTTPVLGLPEMTPAQAGKYITFNQALHELEGKLVRVLSRTTTAEPASPVEGDAYIVPAGATGANWTGQDGKLAVYYAGAWTFTTPLEGVRVWVASEDIVVVRIDSAWHQEQGGAVTVNFTGDTGAVLSAAQNLASIIIATESGAGVTVLNNIILNSRPRVFVLRNETDQPIRPEKTFATGTPCPPGRSAVYYHDGTNVRMIAIDSPPALAVDIGSDADLTLSVAANAAEMVEVTDTGVVLTAGRNVICDTRARLIGFRNSTAQALTLKTAAGTGIAVAAGTGALLWCDGTNVRRLTADQA